MRCKSHRFEYAMNGNRATRKRCKLKRGVKYQCPTRIRSFNDPHESFVDSIEFVALSLSLPLFEPLSL